MKRLLLPLLAALALPTAVNANVDPKVAEICMKASDFRGCIEGMSGGGNNLSLISEYDHALVLFESGDSSGALNAINKYLEKNANSKESYVLRAVIYSWDLENHKDAINDLNKAIEIDDQYALAYSFRGSILNWALSNNLAAKKDLEKALTISPDNPHMNYAYAEYLFDLSYDLIDKDKTNLAINSANEAIQYFKRSISNDGNEKDLMMKRLFPFGVKYDSYAHIGNLKFELYFWYKDIKKRKLAKETLNSAIVYFSKSIELAPSQEETDKLKIERGFDLPFIIPRATLHLYRGNAYSWLAQNANQKNGRKACKDWKISKKYGNKEAKENLRKC